MLQRLRSITAASFYLLCCSVIGISELTHAWTMSSTGAPFSHRRLSSTLRPCPQRWDRHGSASLTVSLRQRRSVLCSAPSHLALSKDMDDDDNCSCTTTTAIDHDGSMSRRHVLSSSFFLAMSATGLMVSPSSASAVMVTTTPATCDATVSVWQRDNRRLVYLLGTAHISEVSAQLAGQLVRDAHPNAVFVELDLKRVGGLLRKDRLDAAEVDNNKGAQEYVPKDNSSLSSALVASGGGAAKTSLPRIVVPLSPTLSSETAASSSSSSSLSPSPQKEGWFQRQLVSIAAATVGRALKSMYSQLGTAGFQPGDEFRIAMEEGQRTGAAILLGDQDVEITMRRLTQALQVTDWQQLQSPEMETKLAELMDGGGGVNRLPPAREAYPTNEAFKKDLSEYVEKLKSRENVRSIMTQLSEVAPALVQVMLTERDAYMARGLDVSNEFDVTVAVMGLAHLDGVEMNLRQYGWKPVRLNCSG